MGASNIKAPTKERRVFNAAKNAYNSYALALAAMETVYDSLVDAEKRNSYIMLGGHIIYRNVDITNKTFYVSWYSINNELKTDELDLKKHTYCEWANTSSVSKSDYSSNVQGNTLALYVLS